MKRQTLEIGERGEEQSKVLAATGKDQPQSPLWRRPQEGWGRRRLRDQVKEMGGGYRERHLGKIGGSV